MNTLLLSVNIFQHSVTQRYNGEDATIEILIMLLGAFILGFILSRFLGFLQKKEIIMEKSNASEISTIRSLDSSSQGAEDWVTILQQLKDSNLSLQQEVNRIASMKLCNCSCCKESDNNNSIIQPIDITHEEKKSTSSNGDNIQVIESIVETTPTNQETPSNVVISTPNNDTLIESVIPESEIQSPVNTIDHTSNPIVTTTVDMKNSPIDDLKIIEGIGPAIERLLIENGIISFQILSGTSLDKLNQILEDAGPRFRVHVPDTWAEQAQLLVEGKMDEFQALIESLKGGRRV